MASLGSKIKVSSVIAQRWPLTAETCSREHQVYSLHALYAQVAGLFFKQKINRIVNLLCSIKLSFCNYFNLFYVYFSETYSSTKLATILYEKESTSEYK